MWRPVSGVLVAALLVLGAVVPVGSRPTVVLAPGGGAPALSVTIDDQTGLVGSIGVGRPDGAKEGIHADPVDPNRLVVTWLGGACDRATRFSLGRSDGVLILHRVDFESSGSCVLVGISRSIVIDMREPVLAEDVVDGTTLLYSRSTS
jgi:hypothetical protein